MSDLSDHGYACLRDAVTIAKGGQVRTRAALRRRLIDAGHSAQHVDEALRAWTNLVGIDRILSDGDLCQGNE